jgi:hypothetical protein
MIFRKKKAQVNRRRTTKGSAKVHNYYTPSQQDRIDIDMSSRKAAKRSETIKTLRGRVEYIIGGIFAILVLYMLLVLKGQPLINVSSPSPNINATRYTADIQRIVESSVFNTNKLTLQRADIENQLLGLFPELESAQVRYSLVGRRPEIYLKVYKIPFIYEAQGMKYSISEVGRVVGALEDIPTAINPVIIHDESGISIKKGDTVMTSSDVTFITEVKSALEQKGRKVEYMRITSVPREIFVKLVDTNYQIRMYLEDDANLQVGTYLAAEKTLGEGGVVPTQYIDVRAGEKVFWQ